MIVKQTSIQDLLVIEPNVFNDQRGYFFESFNQLKFNEKTNTNIVFQQDNQSKSDYGVIRGLHYQLNPYSQTKLVRVLEGMIFDVAVDLRKKSDTYGQWYGLELSAENKKQLLIPQGFAHGFSVLSQTAVVLYKCDNLYNPEAEAGIIYNDSELKIDWKIPAAQAIISEKDINLPSFPKAKNNF